MKLSEIAKMKIKEFEGCVLKAYKCPAGVLTIGFGHTKNVRLGMEINRAAADSFFDGDILFFERSVDTSFPGRLTQGQFDALVSFCYNLGVGKWKMSTLYKKMKVNPNDATIADEFRKYKLGGGRVLPGLVKRREWEVSRYFAK